MPSETPKSELRRYRKLTRPDPISNAGSLRKSRMQVAFGVLRVEEGVVSSG